MRIDIQTYGLELASNPLAQPSCPDSTSAHLASSTQSHILPGRFGLLEYVYGLAYAFTVLAKSLSGPIKFQTQPHKKREA